MDLNKEIETFEQQANDYKKELYSNLKPFQKLQIARHQERPNFLNYTRLICDEFIEMHGDREGTDDRAIIGGLAKIGDKKYKKYTFSVSKEKLNKVLKPFKIKVKKGGKGYSYVDSDNHVYLINYSSLDVNVNVSYTRLNEVK